jgi:hypothetical protein
MVYADAIPDISLRIEPSFPDIRPRVFAKPQSCAALTRGEDDISSAADERLRTDREHRLPPRWIQSPSLTRNVRVCSSLASVREL